MNWLLSRDSDLYFGYLGYCWFWCFRALLNRLFFSCCICARFRTPFLTLLCLLHGPLYLSPACISRIRNQLFDLLVDFSLGRLPATLLGPLLDFKLELLSVWLLVNCIQLCWAVQRSRASIIQSEMPNHQVVILVPEEG
jgi:hypothetical protein